ncbi:protein kinase [Streptomyces sp. NPDC005017]|uniref:serine/threonine-protein kinase n=1 Tax=Streptomyces sp. NPDC005017 TaxID=3364706 RepID=UPI00367D57C9
MQPLGMDEPTAVGPYRLLGRLGSGGMGRVYLGRSAGGRTVAVKVVHPHFALDEEFRARFRREVTAARRVGGAWTAPVLEADPDAPVPWVATAYAAGPSLTAAVAGGGPLPEPTVRALGAGLAEALTVVHGLDLVHRDVKPSNVLLTLDGPLLIDFGIARATDGTASLTSTGVSVGSPGYMSPEQILGKGVTGAADVFSLGAVLAYAATGEPPFPGDSSAALLYKVVHEEPELGGLEGGLRELVADCLAKEPGARPAPGDVARRLAPEGAARLVSGGWLPGALVERVSRSAVKLLNLDAGEPDTPPSGPVGFGVPSQGASGDVRLGVAPTGGAVDAGPGTTAPGGTGGGGFGAPSAGSGTGLGTPSAGSGTGGGGFGTPSAGSGMGFGMPPQGSGTGSGAPSYGSGTGSGAPSQGAAGAFGPPPVMPSGQPVADGQPTDGRPTDEWPTDGRPGTGAPAVGRPGRFSVSVAADAAPGTDGRGRRLSCSLVLAVAGALAAVTVGSVFVFDLLPGDRRDSADGSAKDAYSSAPSASASAPAAGGVPKRYLGTWEGQGTALDGVLPIGKFRITVRQAAVGEELGRLVQTDLAGRTCTDVLTLKQATEKQLVAVSVGAKGNHDGCNPARTTVRLVPTGDDLTWQSDSAESGNPEARMSRVR